LKRDRRLGTNTDRTVLFSCLTFGGFIRHCVYMELSQLSPSQLRKAADVQEKIQSLQKELNQLLGTPAETISTEATQAAKNGRGKRRGMSAAGRAAISAAAKARWAKIKGTASLTKPAPKARRKLSASAIANIRAGVAKRMARKGGATKPAPKVIKRKMSVAGRAAISAAAKARWAKAKAQGKSKLS
jgi:hypothetical protein